MTKTRADGAPDWLTTLQTHNPIHPDVTTHFCYCEDEKADKVEHWKTAGDKTGQQNIGGQRSFVTMS